MRFEDVIAEYDFRQLPTPERLSEYLQRLHELEQRDLTAYVHLLNEISAYVHSQQETSEGWAPFEL